MQPTQTQQGIVLDDHLAIWLQAFLTDRIAAGLSPGTIRFYRVKFANLQTYCDSRAITRLSQLTPEEIRGYLMALAATHNPGGVHAHYRAVKALLNFYQSEAEPPTPNPIRKVKAPKVPDLLLDPIDPADIRALLSACSYDGATLRDKAIIYSLLDTGARASELIDLDRTDVNLIDGQTFIREGKGKRGRIVYLGKDARRAVRAYLRSRLDAHPALFISREGERLSYWGLRMVIEHRAQQAKIKPPPLHGFRRTFAISYLRAGGDIYTLQKLMGHKDIRTLLRYLKLSDADLRNAHARFSPGDRL